STLTSKNTSIIGDIYGNSFQTSANGKNNYKGTLLANLSFDSTTSNPSFYQSQSTDTIYGLADGSSLSFVGKGALRSSKYDSTTGKDSGSVNLYLGVNYENLNISVLNTGGTLNLLQNQFDHNSNDLKWAKGTYNFKGVNISVANGLDSDNNNTNVNMVFANADTANANNLLQTEDNSLITSSTDASGNTKNINDYIEASSLNVGGSVNLRGGDNHFTFIGDKALSTTTKTPIALAGNPDGIKATINFINAGNALLADTSSIDSTLNTAGSILFSSNVATSNNAGGNANYIYNVFGSNISNAIVSASSYTSTDKKYNAQAKVSFNAIFDSRDLDNRVDSNNNAQTSLQYYSDNNAIGDAKLKISKSSLSGTLTLGSDATQANNIVAHLAFYGKDALGNSGKIIGGDSSSTLILDGSGSFKKDSDDKLVSDDNSFNFSAIKGFNGSAYILNSTLSAALEDKSGVSLSTGANVSSGSGANSLPENSPQNTDGTKFDSSDSSASKLQSLNITFNATSDSLKAGMEQYNKEQQIQDVATSAYLSSDASSFISEHIIGDMKDSAGNSLNLDLNNAHTIDKAIGYTTSALNVNFIGSDSIKPAYSKTCTNSSDSSTCTYSASKDDSGSILGFYIHDDNAKNIYNFIDFG
ncbi:hypothetical protein, partial [Helicobacter cappadocius]